MSPSLALRAGCFVRTNATLAALVSSRAAAPARRLSVDSRASLRIERRMGPTVDLFYAPLPRVLP